MHPVNLWRQFDYVLFGATVVLVIFGILMIASATTGAIDTDLISRVPDQIQYAIVGMVLVVILTATDYRLLGGLHVWLYSLTIVLLLLVLVVGQEGAAGAQRWINLGIPVQPSEVGKILLIITLSYHLSQNYHTMPCA